MGLGDRLPFEVAQRIVPHLPERWQRFGTSESWQQASAATMGYEAVEPLVVPQVRRASAPLTGNDLATVAAFGVALSRLEGRREVVTVVDFGGFDGQCADLIHNAFPRLELSWTVVELPRVVERVNVRSRPGLAFTDDLADALSAPVDIAVASASINYVPDPMGILHGLTSRSTATIVTRLPLWPIAAHEIARQRVRRHPEEISYPTWFFSETRFMREVSAFAEVLLDFECPNDRASFAGVYRRYRGMVLSQAREGE